jgi:hypothetical protein
MKRVFISFIVFSMVLISFPIDLVTARTNLPNWASEGYKKFYNLGYLDKIYKQRPNIKTDDGINRAEFVVLLLQAFRLQSNVIDKNSFFKDINGHWAQKEINAAIGLGIIQGYEDETFRPDRVISRAEATSVIVRALFAFVPSSDPIKFADMKNHWAVDYIDLAYAKGFVQGYSSSKFNPNKTISFAEGIVILHRVVELLKSYQIGDIQSLGPLSTDAEGTIELTFNTPSMTVQKLNEDGASLYLQLKDGPIIQVMNQTTMDFKPRLRQPFTVSGYVVMNKVVVSKKSIILAVDNNKEDSITDEDRDGLTNKYEQEIGTNPMLFDTDGDRLSDYFEVAMDVSNQINPLLSDTNGDGVTDAIEDLDGDGLTNLEEQSYSIRPDSPDTDGDQLTDRFELIHWSAGLLDPRFSDTNHDGIKDNLEDYDQDGLTNFLEQENLSKPFQKDSDGDHLVDSDEVNIYKTKANLVDSDEDGLWDDSEIKLGTNPSIRDSDLDGVSDGEETFVQRTEAVDLSDKVNVQVKLNTTGDISKTTSVSDGSSFSTEANDIPGLIGNIASIHSTSDFKEAEITFSYDPSEVEDPDSLQIAWIEPESETITFLQNSKLDTTKNTISANTAHFSLYGLIDTNKWLKAYEKAPLTDELLQFKLPTDYIFVIDQSKDMYEGDPIEDKLAADNKQYRIQITKEYVQKYLQKSDRLGILSFDGNIEVISNLTEDKDKLLNSLSTIPNGGASKNIAGALNQAISMLPSSGEKQKAIVLLSNGHDNMNRANEFENIILKAKNKSISIYTMALGESIDSSLLNKLALETHGGFFRIINDSSKSKSIDTLYKKLSNDNDGDGLPDKLETYGMIQWNAKVVRTSTQSAPIIQGRPQGYDTDRDSLSDGQEMGFSDSFGKPINPKINSVKIRGTVIKYFINPADPTLEDTDKDTYSDSSDLKPKEPYILPIVLLHGFMSNVNNVYGVINQVGDDLGKENDKDQFREPTQKEIDWYTNINSQLIQDNYSPDGLYAYLTSTIPAYSHPLSNLVRSKAKKSYVYAFNYPNFAHVETSAKLLNGYLNNLYKQGYITAPTSRSKPKVILMGHSLGGLVSRYYTEKIPSSQKNLDITAIITIATPHWGGDMVAHLDIAGLVDAGYDLMPSPKNLEFSNLDPGLTPVSTPVESFTEKLNKGFKKSNVKYFATQGVYTVGFFMPETYYYDTSHGPDFKINAAHCITRTHGRNLPIKPSLWNDSWVTLNSGLGSNIGVGTKFSKPTALPFDERYVILGSYTESDHSYIYKNIEVKESVASWIHGLMPYLKIKAIEVQNDCEGM